jgi:hypothetical protein
MSTQFAAADPVSFAVRLQELSIGIVDATPHVFKRAGVYQPSMHEEVRKCYY